MRTGRTSFGLIDFKVPDLHCDYFGTSLHKFLSAPIGTGMMWIREDKIEKVWPLTCNSMPHSADIRKFETLGTRSFPLEQGIGEAINFHEGIGSQRKQERIFYLKNYWATRVQSMPKVKLHTSLRPEYSCAICGVSIDGMTPGQVVRGAVRQVQDSHRGHCLGEHQLRARDAACLYTAARPG